ncbi:MAG: hypothetical protein HQM04_17395 [Magnetococcales bacterium]|nr:hypothetical protein [Magnetococcales bacterium]MBF0116806.1 hypothetical protein [Magnetococcales bacterium]
MDQRSFDQLKELGSGRIAPDGVASLYHQAFKQFGSQSLWSRKPSERPTIAQALIISDCLRHEGNLASRAFAVQMEDACRAAL